MVKLKKITPSNDAIGGKLDWARDVCERAELASHDTLGSFFSGFASDMAEKLEEYGAGTFVSPRQMECLEQLENILDDNGL